MKHDALCPVIAGCPCEAPDELCCQCDLIEKVIQRTISTTDKTWGERARRAQDDLRIVKAQRDLLAERSGLPVPKVNGSDY